MFNKIFVFFKKEDTKVELKSEPEAELNQNEDIHDEKIEIDKIRERLSLSDSFSFTLINQKVIMDRLYLEDMYRDSDNWEIDDFKIAPIYMESLYSKNPHEIINDLKHLSNSVNRIVVELYNSKADEYHMEITIYPEYENQKISLPSYFEISKEEEGFSIFSNYFFGFSKLLEGESERYQILDFHRIQQAERGKVVTLSLEPNSPLYLVWDMSYCYDGAILTLVKLDESKKTERVWTKDTNVYHLSPLALYERLSTKQ